MYRIVLGCTLAFIVGVLVGALTVLYATDLDWLRSTLTSALSWGAFAGIVTVTATVVASLAAVIGLPMIYAQLKHTENQTRAALGDEEPFMDVVERLDRRGEFVVKIVNLNRRAMRVIGANVEEGSGQCRVAVVAINGKKAPAADRPRYALPVMLPGWGNRSEEPPWMMIDILREIGAVGTDAAAEAPKIFNNYPTVIHCTVTAKMVGREGMAVFRSRAVSEREIFMASQRKL
jgi:hypothetical protein